MNFKRLTTYHKSDSSLHIAALTSVAQRSDLKAAGICVSVRRALHNTTIISKQKKAFFFLGISTAEVAHGTFPYNGSRTCMFPVGNVPLGYRNISGVNFTPLAMIGPL